MDSSGLMPKRRGDKPTAEEWNAIVTALHSLIGVAPPLRLYKSSTGIVIGGGSLAAEPLGIPFLNTSGEEIPAYAVMGQYNDHGAGDDGQGGVISVIKPTYFQRRWYINGPDVIPDGGTGYCFTGIDRPIRVLIDEDADPIYGMEPLGPRPGKWGLFPFEYGFDLLGNSFHINGGGSGDEALYGNCFQHATDFVVIEFDGAVVPTSSSYGAKILGGYPGSYTITPWNGGLAAIPVFFHYLKSGTLPAGTRMGAHYANGFWQAMASECPEDEGSS